MFKPIFDIPALESAEAVLDVAEGAVLGVSTVSDPAAFAGLVPGAEAVVQDAEMRAAQRALRIAQRDPNYELEQMAACAVDAAKDHSFGPLVSSLPWSEVYTKPQHENHVAGSLANTEEEFLWSVEGRRQAVELRQRYEPEASRVGVFGPEVPQRADTSFDLETHERWVARHSGWFRAGWFQKETPWMADTDASPGNIFASRAGLAVQSTTEDLMGGYEPSPNDPGWGRFMGERLRFGFKRLLEPDEMDDKVAQAKLLERMLVAEADLYNANVALAGGIFNGIAPHPRLELDAVPVARGSIPAVHVYAENERGPDDDGRTLHYSAPTIIIGMTEEELAEAKRAQASGEDDGGRFGAALEDALEVVCGDPVEQVMDLLRFDHVAKPEPWMWSFRTMARELDDEQLRGLLDLVGAIARESGPWTVRSTLRSLIELDEAWELLGR